MASVKVFHMAIPAVRKITNGTSPDGLTLNPILNTNHKIDIMSNGLINAQKKPRKEPTYRIEISRLAISKIKNLCRSNASTKSTKLLNKFTELRINFIYSLTFFSTISQIICSIMKCISWIVGVSAEGTLITILLYSHISLSILPVRSIV